MKDRVGDRRGDADLAELADAACADGAGMRVMLVDEEYVDVSGDVGVDRKHHAGESF